MHSQGEKMEHISNTGVYNIAEPQYWRAQRMHAFLTNVVEFLHQLTTEFLLTKIL